MPSADFWQSFPTPLNVGSTQADRQISPGIAHSPSRLCPSDLRRSVPCKYWALHLIGLLTPLRRLYPFPVRRARVLPTASSRFHLTMDTLAVRLTLPLAGCVEDFHLRVSAPCRAHQEKGRLAPGLLCDSNRGATECESCCCWHRACRERARACLQTVSPGPDGRCHSSFRWRNPAERTCHPASQQFR